MSLELAVDFTVSPGQGQCFLILHPIHMLGGIRAYSIILFEQESGGSNMGKTVQTEFCIRSWELIHWGTFVIPLGITPILRDTIAVHVFLNTMM